jgi:tetratricopeptide (TPR) repeat protein
VLSVIVAHREQPIPSLRQKRKDVPPALEALFRRMVAKQRADRPASMTEVLAALQECRRPTARWRHAVVAAIVLAVLAVAAPVGWHLGIRKPAGPPVVAAADPIEANAEALSLYRKALRAIELRQERQMEIAIDSLQSAIRLVPNSPRAYAALADAYNLAGDYGWRMPDDSFLLAKQAAQKALQYDEQMADAHLALAFALTEYDCEWKQAEKAHLRALELAPQSAAAHHWYAWFLVYQRRFDEADKHMKKAQDLARDDIIIACNSGKISYYARAYRVAVGKFQQALEMNEDFRKAHWDLGLTYTQMGRLTDAVREFELAKGLAADGRDLQAALACAYASNNEPAKARELVAKLEPLPATRSLAYEVACVYAALGEKNKAFACLDRSFREKSAWRCYIKVDPRLDPIRTDERFDAYLRQAGFLAE